MSKQTEEACTEHIVGDKNLTVVPDKNITFQLILDCLPQSFFPWMQPSGGLQSSCEWIVHQGIFLSIISNEELPSFISPWSYDLSF